MGSHSVAELHQLRNGGIELIVTAEVFADRRDRSMHGSTQLHFWSRQVAGVYGLRLELQLEAPFTGAVHQTPDPI